MGNFYVNFTVKSTDQAAIVAALEDAGRTAYISPVSEAAVVVYDRDSEAQTEAPILAVGELLSRATAAPVLAVLNHDDDLLIVLLFEQGALTISYNSDPSFGSDPDEPDPPTVIDAEHLCVVCDHPEAVSAVENILYDQDYLFVLEQHQALARTLKLPLCSLGFGFTYIEMDDDELAPGIRKADLIRIGEAPQR